MIQAGPSRLLTFSFQFQQQDFRRAPVVELSSASIRNAPQLGVAPKCWGVEVQQYLNDPAHVLDVECITFQVRWQSGNGSTKDGVAIGPKQYR